MKIRKLLLLLALTMGFACVSNAQNSSKYSYATVSQGNGFRKIVISMTGKEPVEIKIDVKSSLEYTAGLNEVKKLTDEGWELFSTTTTEAELIFVLRKREN